MLGNIIVKVGDRVIIERGYKFSEGVVIAEAQVSERDSEIGNRLYLVKPDGAWGRKLWIRNGYICGIVNHAAQEVSAPAGSLAASCTTETSSPSPVSRPRQSNVRKPTK